MLLVGVVCTFRATFWAVCTVLALFSHVCLQRKREDGIWTAGESTNQFIVCRVTCKSRPVWRKY